jgi:putative phosphoesterase
MTIALLSDIHANLPAFEAVLADIDTRKPDAVYCLGDLVGYNVWPNEVIGEIRKRGIATIAGNHDVKVKRGTDVNDLANDNSPKNFAYNIVGEGEKDYLLTLPAHIRLEFILNDDKLNILFVHGSPRKIDEYLLQDMDENVLLNIMKEAEADILCFGHSHKPYHRVVSNRNESTKHYKHAINIGSVGKPKDGDARPCYVLLTLNSHSSIKVPEGINAQFIRVPYNIEKAAKAVEGSPLPNELADMLRKAY